MSHIPCQYILLSTDKIERLFSDPDFKQEQASFAELCKTYRVTPVASRYVDYVKYPDIKEIDWVAAEHADAAQNIFTRLRAAGKEVGKDFHEVILFAGSSYEEGINFGSHVTQIGYMDDSPMDVSSFWDPTGSHVEVLVIECYQ